MKILYITDQDVNNNSGVSLKVRSQTNTWRKMGHVVSAIDFYSMSQNTRTPLNRVQRLLTIWNNSKLIYQLVKTGNFDLVYSRFFLWSFYWNLMADYCPIIFEINGDDDKELKERSTITYSYNFLTRWLKFRACSGLVSVSFELGEKYRSTGIPFLVLANGYEGTSFEVSTNPSDKIHLGFVGNYRDCHGIEKMILLAEKNSDFVLHLIGPLSISNLPENVIIHGPQNQQNVLEILNECDVALSCLSLYKIPLKEASPLKSREYLSLGLPIIYAYEDTDLPDNCPFALKLENTDKNVEQNLPLIRNFILRCKRDPSLRLKARRFFEEKLSYAAKEESRLRFFEQIKNSNLRKR